MPRLWWTALLAFTAIAACGIACAGEIRRETVASASLGRDIPFLVYIPDGYANGELRYPVLYLLHGAGGDETTWLDRGQIKARADKLVASGTIPPALIVMPGCPSCWWVDGARDKAETAFWSDLVPAVASRYRTIDKREGRLVAGLSAGGYGAVRYALKYPDRFAAAAALSPAVYAETPPANSAARRQPPFLDSAGKFDQAAWAARNYPSLMEPYFTQPVRVPLYLVSGDSDQFGIAFETALLFKRLFAQQPELTELRVVDGDHSWAVWANAMDDAMRYVFRYAARPQPPVMVSAPAGGGPLAATHH
jgi:enterochelin esterase-like enzyme